MALWSSNHSNPPLWVDWRRRSLSCPRFNECKSPPCLVLQLSSHDSSVGSTVREQVSNSLSFSCFWASGVWRWDMWSEAISTAFLCKARWSVTCAEGAVSVCLWKRAQAVIERVPRTHPTIKSLSFTVVWVKLQLGEFTVNESVLTAQRSSPYQDFYQESCLYAGIIVVLFQKSDIWSQSQE